MSIEPIDESSNAQPLSVLGLSRRAYNALRHNGVNTVEQLVRLREDDLWRMRQVGIKTVTEILSALSALRSGGPETMHPQKPVSPPRNCLQREWSLPTWVSEDLTPVSALELNVRARRVLDFLGIRHVAQLALLPTDRLWGVLGVGSIGSSTFKHIRFRLSAYAARGPSLAADAPASETQSPTSATASDVGHTFSEVLALWMKDLKSRDRSIVAGRLGLGGKAPCTLEELGQQYNLTRERVRQIVARACRRLARLGYGQAVRPHCAAMHAFLRDKDGLASAEEIRRELGLYVNLGDVEPLVCCQILAELDKGLRWFPSLGLLCEGSRDQRMILTIRRELRKLLPEGTHSMPLSHLLLASATSRSFQERCGAQDETFLVACLRTDPEVTLADGVVTWPPRVARSAQRIIDVLTQLGAPAHYSTITARINASLCSDGQVTERDVCAALQRYTNLFVRTGRGIYGLANWESSSPRLRLELT